jgi:hypothetical protein
MCVQPLNKYKHIALENGIHHTPSSYVYHGRVDTHLAWVLGEIEILGVQLQLCH